MRCAFAFVALMVGALGGCTCFKPVGEADFHDAAATWTDGGAGPDGGTLPGSDGGAFAGDGGDPFGTGGEARVLVGGGVQPVATTASLVFMDCCEAMELVFHTTSALGSLAELHLSAMGAYPTGEVALDVDPQQPVTANMSIGASYHGSGISAAGYRINGSLAIASTTWDQPTDVKACLTLSGQGDPNDGVRLWASAARLMALSWQKRFALVLLSDPSMDAAQAAQQDLGSLALASEPVLDLYSVRYYRGGDHFLAFTLDMSMERLKNALGAIPLSGKPFVVVADGERIYLGAFWSPISSFSPTTPFVMMETVESRGITIEKRPLSDAGADERSDPRIAKALAESGKLAP